MDYDEILQKLVIINKKSLENNVWNSASAATNEIINNIDSINQIKSETESLNQEVTSIENEVRTNSMQAELFGKLDDLRNGLRAMEVDYNKQIDRNLDISYQIATLQNEIQPLKILIDELEKKEKQYTEDIEKRKNEKNKREEEYDSIKKVLTDLTLQSTELKSEEDKRLSKLMPLLEKEIQLRNDIPSLDDAKPQNNQDASRYNAIIPDKKKSKSRTQSEIIDEDAENSYDDSYVHVNVNLFEKLKQNNKDKIHAGPVSCLAFANTNPFIATGGQDGFVKIIRTDNFRQNASITDSTRSIMAMAFSPSDVLFATASYDTVIRFYNVAHSFSNININFRDNRDCVNDAKFLSDDKLVSCCRDQTVKIYDVKRAVPINSYTSVSQPYSITFYQTQVVTSHHDGKLRLWDTRISSPPIEIKAHKSSAIRAVCVHNSSDVVSVGTDRAIIVNDLRNIRDPYKGSINISRSGIPAEYIQIAVTEDSAFIGGSDGQVYDYSLDTYKFKNSRKGHEAPVICVAVKPSIGMMVSGDRSGNVIYWKKEIII